jgi:hypothetical protein
MKKIKSKIIMFMMAVLLCCLCFRAQTEAADTAAFYVQTASILPDGVIEVSVYLNDAKNVGGIDAKLLFDPERVEFVESSLGASLSSSLSDINYDAENHSIHYVVMYGDSVDAHGILFTATFQLKEGESYQPKLEVIDLLDNSDDINDIPYSISYQQYDGTWEEQPDDSATAADEKVIEATLEELGAQEDIHPDNTDKSTRVTVKSDNTITQTYDTDQTATADQNLKTDGNGETADDTNAADSAEAADNAVTTENMETTDDMEMADNTESVNDTETEEVDSTQELAQVYDSESANNAKSGRILTIVSVILIVVVLIGGYLFYRKKKTNGNHD